MTAPALSVNTPNGRHYRHPQSHKEVPSITNVIGCLDKSGPLMGWAAKVCAEYAAKNMDTLAACKTEQERITLIKAARYNSSDGSAKIGNTVHDYIDTYIKHCIGNNAGFSSPDIWEPEDLADAPITAKRMWNQFLFLANHYKIEWLFSEITVWSDRYDYAGTGDAIARIGKSIVYTDWKTGNGVYGTVSIQLAALAGADYAIDNEGNRFELPKPDRFAVGHIRPTYTRLHPVTGIAESFKTFLALRSVFDWKCNYEQGVIASAPQLKGPPR